MKATICRWYDGDAEAARRFYADTFPDSAVGAVHRAPGDYPAGKEGNALAAGGDEAKRVFAAMMTMRKVDIAAIEAARLGAPA